MHNTHRLVVGYSLLASTLTPFTVTKHFVVLWLWSGARPIFIGQITDTSWPGVCLYFTALKLVILWPFRVTVTLHCPIKVKALCTVWVMKLMKFPDGKMPPAVRWCFQFQFSPQSTTALPYMAFHKQQKHHTWQKNGSLLADLQCLAICFGISQIRFSIEKYRYSA